MARYARFEDLPAWQEAGRLYGAVLDVLEESECPFSSTFRNQLERAALSISNNIAEGYERTSTGELLQFLNIARGSAGEVRSMLAVVMERPRVRPMRERLERIRGMAHSCGKQLMAWAKSVEGGPVQGKRHLDAAGQERRRYIEARTQFRKMFLLSLRPDHPLYGTEEAREAREEAAKTKGGEKGQ